MENELKQVIIIDVPIDRKLNRSEEGKGTIMFDSLHNIGRPSNIVKKSGIKDKPVSTKGYWCVWFNFFNIKICKLKKRSVDFRIVRQFLNCSRM